MVILMSVVFILILSELNVNHCFDISIKTFDTLIIEKVLNIVKRNSVCTNP